jgi:adenylosuccinate synthase
MRTGIRVVDLLDRDLLCRKLKRNIETNNELLSKLYNSKILDVDQILKEYQEFDKKIDPYIKDTSAYLASALKQKKNILAEGAQGALLDVDFGTYPFVTSSNPTSGGACTGLGVPPTSIHSIVGVVKAYSTRVGNGPFPTEQCNEIGEALRTTGGEFGATTGRPRRCGWLDLFSLQYSVRINGIQKIAVTKLDVLDDFDEIKVCTGYKIRNKKVLHFPSDSQTLDIAEPEYKSFKGWKTKTSGIRTYRQLPSAAKKYLEAVAGMIGVKLWMVSVGARRDQTLTLQ